MKNYSVLCAILCVPCGKKIIQPQSTQRFSQRTQKLNIIIMKYDFIQEYSVLCAILCVPCGKKISKPQRAQRFSQRTQKPNKKWKIL